MTLRTMWNEPTRQLQLWLAKASEISHLHCQNRRSRLRHTRQRFERQGELRVNARSIARNQFLRQTRLARPPRTTSHHDSRRRVFVPVCSKVIVSSHFMYRVPNALTRALPAFFPLSLQRHPQTMWSPDACTRALDVRRARFSCSENRDCRRASCKCRDGTHTGVSSPARSSRASFSASLRSVFTLSPAFAVSTGWVAHGNGTSVEDQRRRSGHVGVTQCSGDRSVAGAGDFLENFARSETIVPTRSEPPPLDAATATDIELARKVEKLLYFFMTSLLSRCRSRERVICLRSAA